MKESGEGRFPFDLVGSISGRLNGEPRILSECCGCHLVRMN